MRLRSGRAARVRASALLALAALTVVAGGSAARRLSGGSEGMHRCVVDTGRSSRGETTVVVQLAGDPVALVQAEPGRKLSKARRRRSKPAEGQAGRAQRPIAALGGTVLADYQSAYNGIKVRIDRSKAGRACGAPERRRRARAPADEARQRQRRAVHRRTAVWDGVEACTARAQDRRHRHRHRLHARQLRRARAPRPPSTQRTPPTRCRRARRCSARRAEVKGGTTSSATPTTPTGRRGDRRSRIRTRTRSTATATARTSPARPRARACSRTARPTPARTTRRRSHATRGDRPGRRAEGRPLRDPRLRLRRLDRT